MSVSIQTIYIQDYLIKHYSLEWNSSGKVVRYLLHLKVFINFNTQIRKNFVLRNFVENPSISKLEEGNLRKQDWWHLAQNYNITAPSHLVKQDLKEVVVKGLIEQKVLREDTYTLLPQASLVSEVSQSDEDEFQRGIQREEPPKQVTTGLSFSSTISRPVVSLERYKLAMQER